MIIHPSDESAFPHPSHEDAFPGLTKRELLAGIIAAGLAARPCQYETFSVVAMQATVLTDALLAALQSLPVTEPPQGITREPETP